VEERAAIIRAIAEGWDDPVPVLVLADWAEERGTDDPQLLRWYASAVMPAVASVPSAVAPAHTAERDRARKSVRAHPQAGVLFQLAAVAFCRRPLVWDRDGLPPFPGRQAVAVARLFALGLATAGEKRAVLKAATAALREARASLPWWTLADKALKPVAREMLTHRVAELLMDAAGPAVARCAYGFADSNEAVVIELGYQTAIYKALARVSPLPPS
jgi:hypothetical protein